jgi:hypothetical protein
MRLCLFIGHGALALSPRALADSAAAGPVTPNASPEAVALLLLLNDVSGRCIPTGRHNFPNLRSRNTAFAAKCTGKVPGGG